MKWERKGRPEQNGTQRLFYVLMVQMHQIFDQEKKEKKSKFESTSWNLNTSSAHCLQYASFHLQLNKA